MQCSNGPELTFMRNKGRIVYKKYTTHAINYLFALGMMKSALN